MKGFVTLDIETTVGALHRRKASPFRPDNWIVAAAYAKDKGPVIGRYFTGPGQSRGWLRDIIVQEDPQYIVGFNIKFDILHLIRYQEDYEAYIAWIATGGQLWDTQLAEYLLDAQRQESHMLSLDEVAPRYGGSLKIDEVKAMWEAGVDTPDIPQQLLMDYLTGRDLPDGTRDFGDVENTRAIFLGQLVRAKKRGQVKSIQLNNGALVATIEMERNGLYVNQQKGRAQAVILAQKAQELKVKLTDYVPKDLPFEFNWGSRHHLSALIFGGRIKYQQRVHIADEQGNLTYAKKKVTGYELKSGKYTGHPPGASPRFSDDDYVRYGSGKKAGLPKTKQIDVDDKTRPKMRFEDFYYQFPGFTKPRKDWETADPGVYKTGEDVIEELGGQGIEFLDDYADLKDILKDLGTYYITEEFDEDGNVTKAKGMLTLVHDDGLVHANISMVSTVTGRFAHSSPNVGNLPRNDTSDVKQMFESRWGEDGAMMSSDFTSLEVYCQAVLSDDTQLIADLKAGLDMHIKRLSQAEAKPYEWLVEQIKKLEVKEWVVKRKNIKVFSFQRAYGAGPPKIARGLKLPVETVEAWVEADEAMYPGIKRLYEDTAQEARQSRVPTQTFVTHPTAKVPLQLSVGFYRTFDGKRYSFKEYPAPDYRVKRGVFQDFKPTELKNYPVQGLGGEWMKAAMWLAVRIFYHYKNFGGLALLVNTVHDALYADAHKDVKRKAGVVLHAAMSAASDFMEWFFETEIKVPVPSETTWGPSMFEEKKFEDHEDFLKQAEKVRVWIRQQYMDGYTPSFA